MDKFELDGKTYVAKDATGGEEICRGCAFADDGIACAAAPYSCVDTDREDGREIIWVEEANDGSTNDERSH